jgi:hypothetical protein
MAKAAASGSRPRSARERRERRWRAFLRSSTIHFFFKIFFPPADARTPGAQEADTQHCS